MTSAQTPANKNITCLKSKWLEQSDCIVFPCHTEKLEYAGSCSKGLVSKNV